MADLIKIKGGSGAVPVLQERELGYSIETGELYIGTSSGNKRLCGVSDVERIKTLEDKIEEITARFDALVVTSE